MDQTSPPRIAPSEIVAAVLVGAGLAAFYFVSYGDALRTFFYLDDFWVMQMASVVRGPWDMARLFAPSHLGLLLYRPLSTVVYFYGLRLAVGYQPTGYHAVQLGFHVANALLVYALARRLRLARPGAAAASLLYATAPGHATATLWVALFTVTGTAFLYLLTLLVWLGPAARWRLPLTWALCVLAILASELAVTLPAVLLLADLLLDERRAWRTLLRRHAPAITVVTAYVGVKLYLFQYLFPGAPKRAGMEGSLQTAYGVTFDPLAMVRHLGHYVGWSLPFAYGVDAPGDLRLLAAQQATALRLGSVTLAAATASALWVLLRPRARPALRQLAFGLVLFVLALAPVVVLRDHLFGFYVSVAAAGLALALVAAAGALPVIGRGAPVVLALAALVTHARWSGPAARTERLAAMYRVYSEEGAEWLWTISNATTGAHVDEVVVPRTGATVNLFERSAAHRLFLCAPYAVRTTDDPDAEPAAPGRVVLTRPTAIPEETRRSWAWLQAACRAT